MEVAWRGGDGCIYGIPNNIDTVLKIDPEKQEVALAQPPTRRVAVVGATHPHPVTAAAHSRRLAGENTGARPEVRPA
eukprot:scaffold7095_cov260-Pinguiococcus_pyrenoidosus.AAC.23